MSANHPQDYGAPAPRVPPLTGIDAAWDKPPVPTAAVPRRIHPDAKTQVPQKGAEWDPGATALGNQVAGSHYKKLGIQPVEYIHANGIGFCEGNVIKYVTRWRDKGGIKDLEKARHFIDLLIELESKS